MDNYFEKGFENAREKVRQAYASGDRAAEIDARIEMAQWHFVRTEFSSARSELESALGIARAISDRRREGAALRRIAELAQAKDLDELDDDPEVELLPARQALACFAALADSYEVAETCLVMGRVLGRYEGRERESQTILKHGLSQLPGADDSGLKSRLHYEMGEAFRELGELGSARQAYEESLECAGRGDSRTRLLPLGALLALAADEGRWREVVRRAAEMTVEYQRFLRRAGGRAAFMKALSASESLLLPWMRRLGFTSELERMSGQDWVLLNALFPASVIKIMKRFLRSR